MSFELRKFFHLLLLSSVFLCKGESLEGRWSLGFSSGVQTEMATNGQRLSLRPIGFLGVNWQTRPHLTLRGETSLFTPILQEGEGSLSLFHRFQEHYVWLRQDFDASFSKSLFFQLGLGLRNEQSLQGLGEQQFWAKGTTPLWGWGMGFSWQPWSRWTGHAELRQIINLGPQYVDIDAQWLFALGLDWSWGLATDQKL